MSYSLERVNFVVGRSSSDSSNAGVFNHFSGRHGIKVTRSIGIVYFNLRLLVSYFLELSVSLSNHSTFTLVNSKLTLGPNNLRGVRIQIKAVRSYDLAVINQIRLNFYSLSPTTFRCTT
jgi:hypothetical protein